MLELVHIVWQTFGIVRAPTILHHAGKAVPSDRRAVTREEEGILQTKKSLWSGQITTLFLFRCAGAVLQRRSQYLWFYGSSKKYESGRCLAPFTRCVHLSHFFHNNDNNNNNIFATPPPPLADRRPDVRLTDRAHSNFLIRTNAWRPHSSIARRSPGDRPRTCGRRGALSRLPPPVGRPYCLRARSVDRTGAVIHQQITSPSPHRFECSRRTPARHDHAVHPSTTRYRTHRRSHRCKWCSHLACPGPVTLCRRCRWVGGCACAVAVACATVPFVLVSRSVEVCARTVA